MMMDVSNEKDQVEEHGGVQVEPFHSNVEVGSVASRKGIKPRLEERHIQMIAIAGVIVR
jgi:amino acid permease